MKRNPLFYQRLLTVALILVSALLTAAPALSQEAGNADGGADARPATRAGRLVRVPTPITGSVQKQTVETIRRVLATLPESEERSVLVLEFWPGQTEFGAGSEFGASYELANFLASAELSHVKTIAYLPKTIKGHAVLPVLACEEIFMAPDAQIGEAGHDEDTIRETQRVAYKEIAGMRKTVPVAIALGMLDRAFKVLRVQTLESVQYVFDTDLEELKNRETIRGMPETLIEANEMGLFDGRTMKTKLGFVSYLAESRKDVIERLGLPPAAVQPDPVGEAWRSIRVDLKGPIDIKTSSRLQRMIDRQLDSGVNLICIDIESSGGSLTDSLTLAGYLANLDSSKVRTVAYVANEARAEAALVALACDHLVMRSDALLGGRSRAGADAEEEPYSEEEIASAVTSIKELARLKNHRWSLHAAIIDGSLVVFPYTDTETGNQAFMCEAEANELDNARRWQQGAPPATDGEGPLEADGQRALQLGLARDVVSDFDQIKRLYNLEDDPPLVEPNWVDLLVRALSDEKVATFLLFIGGAAVIAELQMPGIGIGGFVASVCFLLFFWSRYLDGTATGLEIILFLAGIVCLAMEIFIIPGFGIFGLGGGLLMIASVVLASQTFVMPRSTAQVAEMQHSLMMIGIAGAGVVTASIMMRRYLPQTPLLNRVFLTPPEGPEKAEQNRREAIVDFADFVGRQGTTTTQCTPSGKALFDDEHVNVITGGESIEKGVLVEITQVEGNRVIVAEIAGNSSSTSARR